MSCYTDEGNSMKVILMHVIPSLRGFLLLFGSFSSLFLSPDVHGQEPWTRFRGPGGSGVSGVALPTQWSANENIFWQTDLPGKGTSSPVWSGDRIYLTACEGPAESVKRSLLCLDRTRGEIQWTREVPSRLPEESKNREDHGYASSTPVIDADRVYVFFGKSGVFAFSHENKLLWHADVGRGTSGWGSAASPIIAGDLLIVNASVESESILGLDKNTGKEVWRKDGIKESWNTPILLDVDGKQELVFAMFGKVLGLDPQTGEQLWECSTEIGWYMAPSLVANDGVVYAIGGRQGGALAVRAGGRGEVTASHRLWKINKGSNVSSPVYHEGRLYWAHENIGVIYGVDATNGEVIYEERLPRGGQIYPSPIIAGAHLYYFNRSGKAFVLKVGDTPGEPQVSELEGLGRVNASPVVCGDRLLVRSDKALVCIGR
ncbi:MAG: outer membrane protein assembly factor BamB [Kiritimatiellia bacterium]|jgi:outer membrane protein assembly factor BamB